MSTKKNWMVFNRLNVALMTVVFFKKKIFLTFRFAARAALILASFGLLSGHFSHSFSLLPIVSSSLENHTKIWRRLALQCYCNSTIEVDGDIYWDNQTCLNNLESRCITINLLVFQGQSVSQIRVGTMSDADHSLPFGGVTLLLLNIKTPVGLWISDRLAVYHSTSTTNISSSLDGKGTVGAFSSYTPTKTPTQMASPWSAGAFAKKALFAITPLRPPFVTTSLMPPISRPPYDFPYLACPRLIGTRSPVDLKALTASLRWETSHRGMRSRPSPHQSSFSSERLWEHWVAVHNDLYAEIYSMQLGIGWI